MIRFGAIVTVVVAAVGLLAVGAVAGDLTLVYVSIALAAVALLLLIVGVAVWRDEVFASSARREERDLAAVGAVGQAGRVAAGGGVVEGWPDRPGPAQRPGPTPSAGPGLQGGDTREFGIPAGPLLDRDAPADRDRRAGEQRPTEQLPRPADPAGWSGRDVRHRDQLGRETGIEDWPGRDLAGPDKPGREAAAAGWPGRDLTAGGWPGRDQGGVERPGRVAEPGERAAREAAAADRAARETVSAQRPDRVERYPIVLGTDRYESADDPTRLAHRLDSLADSGRPADPDATGSATSRVRRPGGQHLPAPEPIDPLIGPAGERRPAADPLAAAPSTIPATATDPGSPGPVPPAEYGHGRPASGWDRSDPPTPGSQEGPPARSQVPSGGDARLPGETVSTAAAGLVFPGSAARVPAARDEGPATATRAPAPPVSAAPAPAAAPVDALGSAAVSERGAAPAGPAEPAVTAAGSADDGAAGAPAIGLDDQVSVVPGIARYHKADCILIRFLSEDDLEVMTRREAEAADCAPCRACRPDRPAAGD